MSGSKSRHSAISEELKLRIISAVILAAFVLLVTWIGGRTFELLCVLVALMIFWEFTSIIRSILPNATRLLAFLFLVLVLIAGYLSSLSNALTILVIGVVSLVAWESVSQRTLWSPTALCYAALPYFAMSQLRGGMDEGLLVIIVLFACVWGADVFAYFSGKTIGGPKLASRISPKKTWAGFIGGIIGALALSVAVVLIAGYSPGTGFVALMLACAVISQLGDLAESVVKRKFDVKDSSNIIPGHGGLLDRIDGLIPAAILLWVVLLIMDNKEENLVELGLVFTNSFLSP